MLDAFASGRAIHSIREAYTRHHVTRGGYYKCRKTRKNDYEYFRFHKHTQVNGTFDAEGHIVLDFGTVRQDRQDSTALYKSTYSTVLFQAQLSDAKLNKQTYQRRNGPTRLVTQSLNAFISIASITALYVDVVLVLRCTCAHVRVRWKCDTNPGLHNHPAYRNAAGERKCKGC